MNRTEEFDYKKYLQLIKKRKYLFVVLALVIMTGVVITSYLLPEKYEARSTVFIEKSVISELVRGIAVTPSFEEKLKVLAYTLKSRTLLLKVLNDLDMNVAAQSSVKVEKMVRDFQENTDIKLKDQEGFFTITFNHENPRLARDYVNTLVRRYIEENTASKREESYDATSFLADQIGAIKAKLVEAESKSDSYKRENGGILAQGEGAVLAEISQAQQNINDVAIKRRQLESALAFTKKNDPLNERLAGLQRKQQELGFVYTDNHPEVVETKNEIAAIKEQLRSGRGSAGIASANSPEVEKITMELNSLRETENSQRRLIASKQALLRSIPAARSGLEELEREKNSQKNLYDQLVARYGQSEVSKQMEVQDKATTFRIVDPAILPSAPYSPQRVKIILLGILGGVAASFGFIVLLDQLDKSVRNVEELKKLGVQVLAVVPAIENPQKVRAERKRDYWFYGVAATCFLLILATVPIELMRSMAFSPAEIKMHLKTLTQK